MNQWSFIKKIKRDDDPVYTFVNYAVAIFYSLLILLPIYFLLVSSFKENQEIYANVLGFPHQWQIVNFKNAIENALLIPSMGISVYVTFGACAVTLLLALPVSYAIAKIPSGLSTWIESLFGAGFLIPGLALLVPILMVIVNLKILYNPIALIVVYPATALPMTVYILSSQFRAIPNELEESAEIDGATRLQTLWFVFIPVSLSGITTATILNFIGFWGEYFFALILLTTQSTTVQVAVTMLNTQRVPDYGVIAAGAILVMIPMWIMFIIFQERIAKNPLAGSVKE